MNNIITTLFLFFSVFFSGLLHGATVVGKCVGVTDGDTATLLTEGKQQIKIRFHGIDAPESGQDFGQRAKQKLSDLIYNKQIKVDILEKDRYGRSVGKVYVGTTYVNLEMVKSGLAWHYKQYAPKDTDLANAEKTARANKTGLWSVANPTAPWDWRKGGKSASSSSSAKSGKGKSSNTKHENTTGGKYWITGSTGKTHRKGCRWYGNTSYGHYSDKGSGDNCKKCGGAGR